MDIPAQQAVDPGTHEIVVPAEVVARSHPTGHSVPIIRKRERYQRPRPYRNLAIAGIVILIGVSGVVLAVKSSIEVGQAAGYHLVCKVVEGPKGPLSSCHWEK